MSGWRPSPGRALPRLVWGLIGVCLMLARAALPADGDALDEVLQSLAARRHGVAHFEEKHYLALLKTPLESSGTLVYDAPDHLEKRTLQPREETIVLDGSRLDVERGHHRRVLDLQAYPQVLPFIESIRATLAGDRPALERIFRLQFVGQRPAWTLVLTPQDPAIARNVAEVRIGGADDELRQVEIRQSDGDRSVMTLSPAAP